jgi:hypothetical protein
LDWNDSVAIEGAARLVWNSKVAEGAGKLDLTGSMKTMSEIQGMAKGAGRGSGADLQPLSSFVSGAIWLHF